MTIIAAKWTIDEYHQLVDSGILDDRRVELLKGIIVEMAPEGTPHAVYCTDAVEYLRTILTGKAAVREAQVIYYCLKSGSNASDKCVFHTDGH
jgi:Uma2 family endonuclease